MNLKTLILIISLILSFTWFSCQQKQSTSTENGYLRIGATLSNISDSTLLKLVSLDSDVLVDSAYVVDGKLLMFGKLFSERPEKLRLSGVDAATNEFLFTDFIVGNERISFVADKSDFPWNIDVSGSVYQDQQEIFHQVLYQKELLLQKMQDSFDESSDRKVLSIKLKQLNDSMDEVSANRIRENFNTYAAIKSFKYHKQSFSETDLGKLYQTLSEDLKDTKEAQAIKMQSENPKPETGDQYYDYTAINQNGDSVSLSDFNNKYLLLHFSSRYCYFSQSSIPEVKKFYEKCQNQIEVVAISQDASKADWLETVERDSINWTYLWDGKAEFNDATIKYWKTGTPNYVLISPDKTILEQWFGYSEGAIENRIGKYFN